MATGYGGTSYSGYSDSTFTPGGNQGWTQVGNPQAPGANYIGRLPGDRPNDAGYMTQPGGSTLLVQGAMPTLPPNLQAFGDLLYQTYGAPAQAAAQNATDNLYDQMLQLNAQGGLNVTQAQQQADFANQGLALNQQGLGIQQAANARQAALLPQQYGLQTQGFDLQQAQDIFANQQQQRALKSSLVTSGAGQGPGANQARSDLAQQLQFQMQGLGLQRQGAGLTYQEQVAQNKDAKEQLGIQAKQLGISEQEVKTRLNNALQQIGISDQVSADQILADINKVSKGLPSSWGNIYGELLNAGAAPMAQNPAAGIGAL